MPFFIAKFLPQASLVLLQYECCIGKTVGYSMLDQAGQAIKQIFLEASDESLQLSHSCEQGRIFNEYDGELPSAMLKPLGQLIPMVLQDHSRCFVDRVFLWYATFIRGVKVFFDMLFAEQQIQQKFSALNYQIKDYFELSAALEQVVSSRIERLLRQHVNRSFNQHTVACPLVAIIANLMQKTFAHMVKKLDTIPSGDGIFGICECFAVQLSKASQDDFWQGVLEDFEEMVADEAFVSALTTGNCCAFSLMQQIAIFYGNVSTESLQQAYLTRLQTMKFSEINVAISRLYDACSADWFCYASWLKHIQEALPRFSQLQQRERHLVAIRLFCERYLAQHAPGCIDYQHYEDLVKPSFFVLDRSDIRIAFELLIFVVPPVNEQRLSACFQRLQKNAVLYNGLAQYFVDEVRSAGQPFTYLS